MTINLEQHIPYKLAVLSNSIKQTTSDRYVKGTDLSSRNWRVLAIIGIKSEIAASQIVLMTGMDKATISRSTSELERADLIKRVPNPNDGRSQLLTLTKEGKKKYRQIIPKMEASADDYKSVLTEGEACLLLELLAKLQQHANRLLDQP